MARTLRFGPPPAADFAVSPSADEIAFFRENGFLAVERLTTDEEIDWLAQLYRFIHAPENAARPGAPIDRAGADAAAGAFRQSFFPEVGFPEILDTAFRRNARRYAAALLGVEEAALTAWGHMIAKGPGGHEAPWHQDHAYWEPEFDYCALGVWLPMSDVTVEMGAMQFIPGSHKRGLLPHRHIDTPENNLLQVSAEAGVDLSTAVACPLKKGGATFHHAWTLHFTARNTTAEERLAFPMEYQLAPKRRAAPTPMPWVAERRAVTGEGAPAFYPADGRFVAYP